MLKHHRSLYFQPFYALSTLTVDNVVEMRLKHLKTLVKMPFSAVCTFNQQTYKTIKTKHLSYYAQSRLYAFQQERLNIPLISVSCGKW